ncbi:MAG: type II toxin-antitoxin system prevent-host-death family antitoxin, partial [Firmicutes bacterium]|nr:type II toxin-antitoxin system prevent-host-death family antitoxin [Bacillota bacterium]
MILTTTELQNNFGKYLNLMQNEPIIFTKNGKIIGKLVPIKG